MDKGKSIVSRGGYRIQNNNINDTNDRSKVRILLCDSDPESCQEVFSLLCKCSYQVTTVLAADVIHKLNIEGSCIDIILAEANILVANGADILKYIMRNMELKRIPLIILSKPDQLSLISKCLRLGAADYLVKPPSENELLNLWMHVGITGASH
ncbi:Two-component response regulator-like [Actinidia chinensis var. chinensis]|uniref:Two-component response regulator-like n=1 Tax=Actinidia chinensis var. chinensis TaxID=1590841 RepID=A0A2R6QH70_ACTCC|nr:Two-component response regulator-like [Actinidia chinensis var. chinensis]